MFYLPEPVDVKYLLLVHEDFSADRVWSRFRVELRDRVHASTRGGLESGRSEWKKIQMAAQQFRGENYTDTSAITHYWLYEKKLDGVVYPSVRDDDYCNFALAPRFVEESVRFHCVHLCRWRDDRIELVKTATTGKRQGLVWEKSTIDDWSDFADSYRSLLETPNPNFTPTHLGRLTGRTP